MRDSQVSDPGAFSQGGAGLVVTFTNGDVPPSELEQAIQLLDLAVGEYEATLPALWTRFDAVVVAESASKPIPDVGEVPMRFQSVAAHRLEALVARLHAATSRLVAFHDAGQA